MNFEKLVDKVYEDNNGMSKKDIKNILKSCFNTIAEEVLEGNDVSIHGFGVFSHTEIKERIYESNGIVGSANVKTIKPAHKKAKFKPFKTLSNF